MSNRDAAPCLLTSAAQNITVKYHLLSTISYWMAENIQRGKVTFRHFGRIIQDHFLKKPLVALSCSQFRTKYRLSKRIRLYCGTYKYQDNSEYAVEYEDPYGESHKSDVET